MWLKFLLLCLFAAAPNVLSEVPRLAHQPAVAGWYGASALPGTYSPARRIALVIGNAGYTDRPLRTPLNDARAMSRVLGMLGFKVLHYENASRADMQRALHEFKQALHEGGVGLFYFSGHGLQVIDRTLLEPIDPERHSPARVLTQSLDLQSVLRSMSEPRPDMLNLVILDTCLNNPFQTGSRALSAVPAHTLVAFPTAPGALADDGTRHGLYTLELLHALPLAGQDLEQMFERVAVAVRARSHGKQQPWISSSLSRKILLAGAARDTERLSFTTALQIETASWVAARGILPKDSAEQYELTFWESIKDSNQASDYEAYLQAYPNGRFAALARSRIERLRAAAPKPAPAAPKPAEPARKPPTAAHPAPKPAPAAPAAPPAAPAPAPPAPAAAAAGEIKSCADCPPLVALPAGSFVMGNNSGDLSERPAHHVTLKNGFAIGKYEVTVGQWNACVSAGGCPRVLDNDAHAGANSPIRNVSWDEAQQYVKWLSTHSGKPFRLPTEAEWEYAARGGTTTRFWWGEQMKQGKANCKDCGQPWHADAPDDVGSFAANPYGLFDVNGSVWEWVADCWHNNYKGAPADGRAWDDPNCRVRVIRGGSWRQGESYMPSTTRFKYDASVRNSENGFRVASDLK